MLALVGVTLAVLLRFAGDWGVPYFSFTSERGSPCRNDLTGHTCSPLTLADVEFYTDLDLPDDTAVRSGRYRATHDYELEAVLEVPAAGEADALAALRDTFGRCLRGRSSALDTDGLRKVCVQSDDGSVEPSAEGPSRVYTVGSGVREDGTRVVAVTLRSR